MKTKQDYYKNCSLCPRNCLVDRTRGETGYCGQPSNIVLSSALLHGGEEPPVSGEKGSGTLFFTGCTLKCSFCQNSQISRENMGREISEDEFAEICIMLQIKGAENINLVTGSHFIPSIISGLETAKMNGLDIPVLWNGSGYETEQSIRMLCDYVDIFLPDYKTADPVFASHFFNAPDYPDAVFKAVSLMTEMKKTDFSVFETGKMLREGVIIRHLVMPGFTDSSEKFLDIYSRCFRDKAILSVMFQYSPEAAGIKGENPERTVSEAESENIYKLIERYNIENGFIQELEDDSSWIPDFRKKYPFPGSSGERGSVWHWEKGFL